MARASWKDCSMSGDQTPSASAAAKSLSSSQSPTSRSRPLSESPGPDNGVHGEAIVAVGGHSEEALVPPSAPRAPWGRHHKGCWLDTAGEETHPAPSEKLKAALCHTETGASAG